MRATARVSSVFAAATAAVVGCAGPLEIDGVLDPAPAAADLVIDAPGASGEGFGDARRAVDGVRGAGANQGSLNTYSLDYGSRAHLVLAWSRGMVRNGPGTDLVVFENPFRTPTGTFMDPVVVEVSRDGVTFVAFPHAYVAEDPALYSADAADWEGFAGRTPVLLHQEDNAVDPFDPVAAGGDGFDLDALAEGPEEDAIRREGFRFVRLTSAAIVIDPATGAPFPREAVSNGADIDGVYARWLEAR